MSAKPIQSIPGSGGIEHIHRQKNLEKPAQHSSVDFKELLRRAKSQPDQLHFSKHVQDRIDQRNISMDADSMQHLLDAVGLAAKKGIRDSLVLMQDAAYIVNVPSKTVVTAMNRAEAQQRVFTNIDGAIVY